MYMDLSQLFQDYINFHSELENLVSSLPQEENGRPESRQHVKSVKRDIEDLCAKLSAAGYVRMQSPAALFARWLATDATQVGTWRWKSSADPARGTASRTARVSTARWNLKEAGCQGEEFWRAKFRTDEQKPHIRPNWNGRFCNTRRSPMLPEFHTVNEAVT